jgi:hypothetical protein
VLHGAPTQATQPLVDGWRLIPAIISSPRRAKRPSRASCRITGRHAVDSARRQPSKRRPSPFDACDRFHGAA